MYRGETHRQNCVHLRVPVYRLRYLRQEVSVDYCTTFLRADSVSRCPFEAIAIINLPTNLEKEVTHRYTANSFKLHRLPTPRPGQVLGLVGTNGIGKSTALKVLAGKLKPNLGRYDVGITCSSIEYIALTDKDRIRQIGKKFSSISAARSCKTTSPRSSRIT